MASAIRILALLDLSDREIADLFDAEAGEGTACDHSLPAIFDGHDGERDARPWRRGTLAEAESVSMAIGRIRSVNKCQQYGKAAADQKGPKRLKRLVGVLGLEPRTR